MLIVDLDYLLCLEGFLEGLDPLDLLQGSIETTRPNEAWHVDTTFVRTQDGVKAAVQFVMDSFSRKILAWNVMLKISAVSTVDLLRKAIANSGIDLSATDPIILLTDGGPENKNEAVSQYTTSVPVKHLIAQVDIHCSNSLIEAFNKIFKYGYIFRKLITDFKHLEAFIRESVLDYGARPHSALKGLSPDDCYAGKVIDLEGYRVKLALAQQERLAANRKSCGSCAPLFLEA